jgi:hypothetical protein
VKSAKPLMVVGWRELVSLPEIGLANIPAKIDTGARTSALNARVIETFAKGDTTMVRFAALWNGQEQVCEAPVVDRRSVRSSNGEMQERFVIKTPLRIGKLICKVEVTLADRSEMQFPMLVGRTALRRRMVVDSSHSWVQSQRVGV